MVIKKAALLLLVLSSSAVNAVNDAAPEPSPAATSKVDNHYTRQVNAIAIPADIVESSYQLIGTSFMQTKVVAHFNQVYLADDSAKKTRMLIAASKHTTKNASAPFAIFTFADGATAYAVSDFVDMEANIHLKFTKLTDANGNTFNLDSENPFNATKNYDVTNMSLASWRVFHAALRAYDLFIPGTSNMQVPKGIVTIKDCSSSTEALCKSPA